MTIAPENPAQAAAMTTQPVNPDPVSLANQIATMSTDVLHAEFLAVSRHAAALLTQIGGLPREGCRAAVMPAEALIEMHVLHMRDAIAARAGKTRGDNGAGLLARLSSSATHAAEDLADTQRWY